MENNDKRVRKYIQKIIVILPARPNNQQRALLKVLQKMELVQEYEAPIFNLCANIWKDIKIYAFSNQNNDRYCQKVSGFKA